MAKSLFLNLWLVDGSKFSVGFNNKDVRGYNSPAASKTKFIGKMCIFSEIGDLNLWFVVRRWYSLSLSQTIESHADVDTGVAVGHTRELMEKLPILERKIELRNASKMSVSHWVSNKPARVLKSLNEWKVLNVVDKCRKVLQSSKGFSQVVIRSWNFRIKSTEETERILIISMEEWRRLVCES